MNTLFEQRNKLNLISLFFFISIFNSNAFEKKDSLIIKTSAFLETYYGIDFSNPKNNQRQEYFYNNTNNKEFSIDLVLVKTSIQYKNFRSVITPMFGSYAKANLKNENGLFKNVYEANAGIKLASKNETWLDVGILPSHIGFESAISKDNITLTHSFGGENSPYYETGLRLNCQTKKIYFAFLLINGWQKIRMLNNNFEPSLGGQISMQINEKLLLNYSNFIGKLKIENQKLVRHFHNTYLKFSISKKLKGIIGYDLGFQQSELNPSNFQMWQTPQLCIQFLPVENFGITFRMESYVDKYGIMIKNGKTNNFIANSLSINTDYYLSANSLVRLEARKVFSKNNFFGAISHDPINNYLATLSFCYWLDE